LIGIYGEGDHRLTDEFRIQRQRVTMSKARQRFLYLIYFFITTVIFLYLLFPSEAAKQFLMTNLNQINPDVEIAFERVKPVFPPGLGLSDVQIFHRRDPVFKAEKVKVALGILPLFVLRPTLKFNCDAYEGSLKGKAGVSVLNLSNISADVRLKNVNIESIDALHMVVPQYDLSGKINGNIKGSTQTDEGVFLKSGLRLTDFSVEFLTPLYGLHDLLFTEIETEFEMNGTLLKIDRLVAKGDDLSGNVSGTVTIKQPIQRSKLNIKGEVNPGPNIIKELGELEPMVSVFLKNRSGKGIPINLNGTLNNPGFFKLPRRR